MRKDREYTEMAGHVISQKSDRTTTFSPAKQTGTERLQLCPVLPQNTANITQGSFTRYGGASSPPYNSHNISFGVGDDKEHVRKNRQAIKDYLGLKFLVSAHQVHGDEIYVLSTSPGSDLRLNGYDALITALPGVGLVIGHADCQAVLLFDPVRRVIAAVHSGWRGSVANIVASTIETMQLKFQSNPADLLAGVGPSLGPCCSEFINYQTELPKSLHTFAVKENYFDFWQITRHQLRQCGMRDDAIFNTEICTSCSPDYFSYRRARRNGSGITGRNCSIIVLHE